MLHYTLTDQSMISQADLFAATKHAAQTRKDGTPYIHHPRYVSVLAGQWAQQYFMEPRPIIDHFSRLGIIRVVGLCHDLIEDQGVTHDVLYLLFGKEVADAVALLSNDKSIKDHDERNVVYCKALALANIDVQFVKLADIYHNAISVAPNPRFGSKWVKKAQMMLHALSLLYGTIFYHQTENALKVREELSCGPNISGERVGSNGESAHQENGAASYVAEEPTAAHR